MLRWGLLSFLDVLVVYFELLDVGLSGFQRLSVGSNVSDFVGC